MCLCKHYYKVCLLSLPQCFFPISVVVSFFFSCSVSKCGALNRLGGDSVKQLVCLDSCVSTGARQVKVWARDTSHRQGPTTRAESGMLFYGVERGPLTLRRAMVSDGAVSVLGLLSQKTSAFSVCLSRRQTQCSSARAAGGGGGGGVISDGDVSRLQTPGLT